MRVLYIDYALWKSIVQAQGFSAFHRVGEGEHRQVWAGLHEVIYAADVNAGAEHADWQPTFEATSTLCVNEDAALANIMGLGATISSKRSDGVLRVQLEPSTKASKVYVEGVRWTAELVPSNPPGTPPQESHGDLTFGTLGSPPVDFQGIEGLWASNVKHGDYIELIAMFPETATKAAWEALGLGPWPFGGADTPAQAGQPDVPLFKFGRTIYLPPGGHIESIVAEGTFTIAAPVFLRFCYFANGIEGTDTAPEVYALCRVWEGL